MRKKLSFLFPISCCCFLLAGSALKAVAYSQPVTRRQTFDAAVAHAFVGANFLSPLPCIGSEQDESRLTMPVETSLGTSYSISIPRIGCSLYKTESDQVPRCVELALLAGVQHFDVASQYGTNEQVGKVLKSYLVKGMEGVPNQPTRKATRREQLFVCHKVSNAEQSDKKSNVKKAVKNQMKKLQVDYLDLCSVHSPLTDSSRRLTTYAALLDLQNEGIVKSVGVCNYGTNPLRK